MIPGKLLHLNTQKLRMLLYGKMYFVDVIKLGILSWGDYPELSGLESGNTLSS